MQDPTSWDTIDMTGVERRTRGTPVSQGIDKKKGVINCYELLPELGDSVTITNFGTHFELRHYHWSNPPLLLTDDEMEMIKTGHMTWH